MRRLIRSLDAALRRRMGIYEFQDDPDCLLRVRPARAARPLPVPGGEIPAGAAVLELHFWNEQLPRLPADGPDLGWAVRGRRMMERSLHALARYVEETPSLAAIEALVGVTVLFGADRRSGAERLFRRLGFAARPYRGTLGGFGRFWENVYSWLIMWAFNRATLRERRLFGMPRTEIWITREEFLRRYGPSNSGSSNTDPSKTDL